jgi:hypothetical protein
MLAQLAHFYGRKRLGKDRPEKRAFGPHFQRMTKSDARDFCRTLSSGDQQSPPY